MPDTAAMKTHNPPYPERFWVAPVLEQGYRTLPKTFLTAFKGFGDEPRTAAPTKTAPAKIEPFSLSGMDSKGITNYQSLVVSLNNSFNNLQAANALVTPAVQDTALSAMKAQQNINTLILEWAGEASKPPIEPMNENQKVMEMITKVTENLATIVNNAKTEMQGAKGDIDAAAKTIQEQNDKIAKLQAQLDAKAGDPPGTPPGVPPGTPPGTPPGGTGNGDGSQWKPPNIDPGLLNPGNTNQPPKVTPTPDPTTPPTPDPTKPPSTPDNPPSDNGNGKLPDTTPPNSMPNQYPNMGNASPISSGMDPMSMMLPSLLSGMMPNMNDRFQADPDRYNRYEEPYNQYPQNAVPMQANPPAATPQTPATTPPSTTTTSVAPTDKPAPAQPAAPAPLAPDADGGVDYPFPDGKTQRVSVIVAKALDKAFGNKKGTDAQAAYADTTAKWSDTKQIGDRVDPSQLMTGDVGIWESPDMVAIVRAMGSEGDASLDLIVNGELRRYPDQISETTGDLGKLVGWAHPRGIEITGTSAKHGDGPAPGIGAPAAPMPVVAAPAS
ncbi:hypothetical protein AB0L82_40955 [Nocardia sp. NPDC052001]|uniref:hypothetical protein n=1 Tax=Nocardia sp. NPDC052001 TaxID=3154853 RepID=UPI003429E1AE